MINDVSDHFAEIFIILTRNPKEILTARVDYGTDFPYALKESILPCIYIIYIINIYIYLPKYEQRITIFFAYRCNNQM